MAMEYKNVRTTDISRREGLLSALDDLAPLPAPYDKNGLEPAFKDPKPEWAETNCCSLDGFCAIDTMKRPETQEEEDELKVKFLKGLEKLFLDANNKYLQPLSLTMEYCAKCNTCSEACHVYKAANGDEIYRPIFRVDVLRKLYKKYFTRSGKLLGSLTGADIDLDWETIARLGESAYRCNLCRRCAQVCPMGLDNGMAAREIRKIFSMEMGLAPTPVHAKGTQLQLKTGSSTGLTRPALLDTLEFIEEDTYERTGRKIKFPLDKKGADVLLFHNAGEFMAWPENPAAFAILLDEAGVDWTLSTDVVGYDSVNYGIWYDDVQAKNVAMAQFEAARKLGVKRIVIGECGHAHKAAVVGADRMADSEERGVPVESFLPMMAESRAQRAPEVRPFEERLPRHAARSVQHRAADGHRRTPARDPARDSAEIPRDDAARGGQLLLRRRQRVRHHELLQLRRLPHEGERAHEVRPDHSMRLRTRWRTTTQ